MTKYSDKAHDRKLRDIEKYLGPDALDTPEAEKAELEGSAAMIRHVNKLHHTAMKEHESPHWKEK